MPLGETCRRLDVPKSAAHRLLTTLCELGWTEQDPTATAGAAVPIDQGSHTAGTFGRVPHMLQLLRTVWGPTELSGAREFRCTP